jgi:protein-tyrosine phosphatase
VKLGALSQPGFEKGSIIKYMNEEMTTMTDPRLIPLEGCLNFRDLGGYTGEGGRKVRRGRIYRADDLSKLSPADIVYLGELGISTAIDLRSIGELNRAPSPLRGRPGFTYHHVQLLDGVNSAPDGIPRIQNLPEMYKSLLPEAGPQIRRVFQILHDREGRGVVFHCTAGKDRTGVIAALILNLCGVSDEDVITDYALTYELMRPFFDVMAEEARKADTPIPEQLFQSEPAFMREFLSFLKQTYGGAESYLVSVGLAPQALGDLKKWLLG